MDGGGDGAKYSFEPQKPENYRFYWCKGDWASIGPPPPQNKTDFNMYLLEVPGEKWG